MSRLAVFFPGIGYTMDRPLLHFGRRLASGLGYETKPLAYGGFPQQVRGDRSKMEECFRLALSQAEEALAGAELAAYEDVLFVGKSIGTVVAARIAAESPARDRIRAVLYTPLEDTFLFPLGEAIAFTGGGDPWVGGEASRIPALCAEHGVPCTVIPGANHSLETGDVSADIETLRAVMEQTRRFIRSAALTGQSFSPGETAPSAR